MVKSSGKWKLTETRLCLDLDWSSTRIGAEHFSFCFVVMLPYPSSLIKTRMNFIFDLTAMKKKQKCYLSTLTSQQMTTSSSCPSVSLRLTIWKVGMCEGLFQALMFILYFHRNYLVLTVGGVHTEHAHPGLHLLVCKKWCKKNYNFFWLLVKWVDYSLKGL